MATVRLDLAYDGSGFHGFARQQGVRTVQGVVEEGLEKILGYRPDTTGAGRTDTGVHARHQVVTFETDLDIDPERLRRSLDGLVGSEVSIAAAATVAGGFNARFSPTWRRYRYFLDHSAAADPLTRNWIWHLGRPVDVTAMNRAAAGLVGEHDFASFCRSRSGATTVRNVLDAAWAEEDSLVRFEIRARAFCHQMVRSIVGFCVDVGLGRVPAESVGEVLAARNRQAVGTVAPPHGLVLWEVGFD